MNKSIGEELTPEELNKILQKDRLFSCIYNQVEAKREHLATNMQKAEWVDLSYKRLYKFCQKTVLDSLFTKSHVQKYTTEWERKYGHYAWSADSLDQVWRAYLKSNALTSYVKIEFVNIEKKYVTILPDLRAVFRITPLRGAIDQLHANYDVYRKGESLNGSFSSMIGTNFINVNERITGPVLVKSIPTLGFRITDDAGEMDFEAFAEKYDWRIDIDYIQKDGEEICDRKVREKIPDPILQLWGNKTEKEYSDWQRDWDISRIVTEILQESYELRSAYIFEHLKKAHEEADSLAARFYYLGMSV